jgi:ribosomal-protein-alanine N-acetyltransferase
MICDPMAAPIELHTQRLLLRPFQSGDAADALAYRDDEQFARFLSHIPQPYTQEDAEAFVMLNMSVDWNTSPTFAVVFDGKLIGTVNLEVNSETRSALLGYAIGRLWWGQGIATEAARAVMAWGIREFDLTRIRASTDVRHAKSQRVLEKLGMKRKSLEIGHHIGRNGESVDEVLYGLELAH